MNYKLGENVIIRDDLEIGGLYDAVRFTEEMESIKGKKVKILGRRATSKVHNYVYSIKNGLFISDFMINDEKTKRMNHKEKIGHKLATDELEKQADGGIHLSMHTESKESENVINEEFGIDKNKLLAHYQNELKKSEEAIIIPDHYKRNGLDLIEIWKLKYSPDHFRSIMKAQIDRYITRYEEKNGIQDLDKAIEYIRRLKEWEKENE